MNYGIMATKYLFNGKEIRMTIAVRHPLIDEVKASASKCILDVEKGKLYVAYNTPFNASLLGNGMVGKK